MKKLIGYFILLPTVALSCLGNFGLYGNASLGMVPRNIVVLLVSLGIECALVLLTHEVAKRHKAVEDSARSFTIAVMLALMTLSTVGQYCFLLKGAVGHEIVMEEAQVVREDSSSDKEALRAERDQLMAAIAAEQKTGWGKKAADLSTRLDAVKAQLASIDVKKQEAVTTVADSSEFLIACAEFNLPVKTTLKIAVGVFVLVANVSGFWLLFLAYLEGAIERERHYMPPAYVINYPETVAPAQPAPEPTTSKPRPAPMRSDLPHPAQGPGRGVPTASSLFSKASSPPPASLFPEAPNKT